MTDSHPNRVVLFAMLGVIIGAAIQFAIQDLVSPHGTIGTARGSWLCLLTTGAFILNAINFYHGKSNTLSDPEYVQALFDKPNVAIFEFLLTTSVILCFAFLAFDLSSALLLLEVAILCRVLDIILIALILRTIEHRAKQRREQKVWLWIDVGVIVLMAVSAYISYGTGSWVVFVRGFFTRLWETGQDPIAVIASGYVATAVLDVFSDYLVFNKDLYTEKAPTWNEKKVADHWDAAQGDFGDLYRQKVISPGLVSVIDKFIPAFSGKRVLDVGCGNGCVSRALAVRFGKSNRFTCIDNSNLLLEHCAGRNARLNLSSQIEVKREPLDICDPTKWREIVGPARYDLAIACFTLQDCGSLETPLAEIARHLEPEGWLMVIYENQNAFSPFQNQRLSSRRPWSTTARGAETGKGERWIVTWEDTDTGYGGKIQTITRFWGRKQIALAGRQAGLQVIEVGAREARQRQKHVEATVGSTVPMIRGSVEDNDFKLLKPLPFGLPDYLMSYAEAARISLILFRRMQGHVRAK